MSRKLPKAGVYSREVEFAILLLKNMTAWYTNFMILRYGTDLGIVASSPKVGRTSEESS